MNKNTKQRRAVALRNFRVGRQRSTEFEVAVMRPGGYVKAKCHVPIGFVTPPESARRRSRPVTAVDSEKEQLDELVTAADELLGKSRFDGPPPREGRSKAGKGFTPFD